MVSPKGEEAGRQALTVEAAPRSRGSRASHPPRSLKEVEEAEAGIPGQVRGSGGNWVVCHSPVLDSGELEGNKDHDTDHSPSSNYTAGPAWPRHLTGLVTRQTHHPRFTDKETEAQEGRNTGC